VKTGPQSNYFDYDTGVWNDTESIPQDFNPYKPFFSSVLRSLLEETLEEQLIRLGKIQRTSESAEESGK
jgi:hypothetical protein